MASSMPDSLKSFEENGYFVIEDQKIGSLVRELEKQGLSGGKEAIDIAKSQLLANAHARPILKPYLDHPDVRISLALSDAPNNRYVFSLAPGQKDHIILHMFSAGAEAEFSGGSHVGPLKAATGSIGLFEVANATLKLKKCLPIPFNLRKGGIAIHDPRQVIRIMSGSTSSHALMKSNNDNG